MCAYSKHIGVIITIHDVYSKPQTTQFDLVCFYVLLLLSGVVLSLITLPVT